MSLGDNIKKIREQKGLLQKQLAAEVNIPYTSYNKVETTPVILLLMNALLGTSE